MWNGASLWLVKLYHVINKCWRENVNRKLISACTLKPVLYKTSLKFNLSNSSNDTMHLCHSLTLCFAFIVFVYVIPVGLILWNLEVFRLFITLSLNMSIKCITINKHWQITAISNCQLICLLLCWLHSTTAVSAFSANTSPMLSLCAFASQAALLLVSVQLVSEVEDERKKGLSNEK